jgi:aspartate carbamoyltransferase catalytic subunit
LKNVDFFYATRYQRERHTEEPQGEYPPIDAELFKEERYRRTKVMHPLPRVDELSYEMDQDPRGVYFKQAAYGVPVRMALIASLLELYPSLLKRESSPRYECYAHPQGMSCVNNLCITRAENERRHLSPKFWLVGEKPLTIRCVYCDYEYEPQVISRASTRKYTTEIAEWRQIHQRNPRDLVLFVSEQEAIDAGHELRRSRRRPPAHPETSEIG